MTPPKASEVWTTFLKCQKYRCHLASVADISGVLEAHFRLSPTIPGVSSTSPKVPIPGRFSNLFEPVGICRLHLNRESVTVLGVSATVSTM